MRRLRDDPGRSDAVAAYVARLLSEVRPVEITEAQAARMRRAIDRPRHRLELRLLRPTAVVAAVICLLATAGAAYATVRLLMDRAPSTEAPLGQAPVPDLRPQPVAPELAPEPVPREADLGVAPEAISPRRAAPAATTPAVGIASGKATADSDAQTKSPPGATLVVDAMRALRHEKNPAKAARLLDQYQKQYPSGALAEEALALQMESAVARNDPSASRLAAAYLSRFPQGRFRAAAQQVLSQAKNR